MIDAAGADDARWTIWTRYEDEDVAWRQVRTDSEIRRVAAKHGEGVAKRASFEAKVISRESHSRQHVQLRKTGVAVEDWKNGERI